MPHRSRPLVRTAAAALLAGVSLAACRGEKSDSKRTGVFPLHPNPVKVTVSRDSTHSASAKVPVAGGTVTATGSDGSRFTLTIPPKVLDGDTTITMTPISSIAGLPLSGGLVAAVHLEPEGLHFNAPVLLRIEPSREVPIQQQVGIGYLGGGNDLHLYPLDSTRALGMRLLHFSGVGVAAGTPAEVRALEQRSPADAGAQLEQQIASLLNAERQAGLTSQEGDPDFSTKLTALLQDFYDHVVLPKIDAAKATDDWRVMFDAVQTAMSFVRMSVMVGEDQSALSRLLPVMEPILVRAFDRAYYHCKAKVGGEKEARMLMIIVRHAALSIFGIDPNGPRFSQDKIQRCFAGGSPLPPHLELSFEATIIAKMDGDGNEVLMSAASTMRLNQTEGSTTYYTKGWPPIVYREFRKVAGPGCPSYTDLKGNDGVGSMGLVVHPDGQIGAMGLSIEFEKGPWEEWTRVDCEGKANTEKGDSWARAVNVLENVLTKENKPGYVGVPTGMSLTLPDTILSSTIERTDYAQFYKKGVIKYTLKVLP